MTAVNTMEGHPVGMHIPINIPSNVTIISTVDIALYPAITMLCWTLCYLVQSQWIG